MPRIILILIVVYILGAAGWIIRAGVIPDATNDLLNVSYDPTRELWSDLNAAFIPRYEAEHGIQLNIRQSHGGSSSQARSVMDGLDADVVTLALRPDTDAIRKKGLIDPGWEERLPNRSLPYYSTIVFVVRRGNPKNIHDWPDLVRPGVSIVTPDPKKSGNGKLSFAAAWGAVLAKNGPWQGGSDEQAREFATQLYRQVPVLDSAARDASTTFAQRGIGDVHLTWENEAYLEVRKAGGALEIVYPSISIKAEPHVAVVDANVRRKNTREPAEAYMRFLYSDEAQEIIARHHYRPCSEEVLQRHSQELPGVPLFPITLLARDWDDAQERFFSEGGVFDEIFTGAKKATRSSRDKHDD